MNWTRESYNGTAKLKNSRPGWLCRLDFLATEKNLCAAAGVLQAKRYCFAVFFIQIFFRLQAASEYTPTKKATLLRCFLFGGKGETFQCQFLKIKLLIIRYIKFEKCRFLSRWSTETAESNLLSANVLHRFFTVKQVRFFDIFLEKFALMLPVFISPLIPL